MKRSMILLTSSLLVLLMIMSSVVAQTSTKYTFPAKKGDIFEWEVTKAVNVEDVQKGDRIKVEIVDISSYIDYGVELEYAIIDVYEKGVIVEDNFEYKPDEVLVYIYYGDMIPFFIYTESDWVSAFKIALQGLGFSVSSSGGKIKASLAILGSEITYEWEDGILDRVYVKYGSQEMELKRVGGLPMMMILIAVGIVAVIVVVAIVLMRKRATAQSAF